jgi:hypothetical protein
VSSARESTYDHLAAALVEAVAADPRIVSRPSGRWRVASVSHEVSAPYGAAIFVEGANTTERMAVELVRVR